MPGFGVVTPRLGRVVVAWLGCRLGLLLGLPLGCLSDVGATGRGASGLVGANALDPVAAPARPAPGLGVVGLVGQMPLLDQCPVELADSAGVGDRLVEPGQHHGPGDVVGPHRPPFRLDRLTGVGLLAV